MSVIQQILSGYPTSVGSSSLFSDNVEHISSGAAVTAGWTNVTGTPGWAYATAPAPLLGSYSVRLVTGDEITHSFTASGEIWTYCTFIFTSGIGTDQYPFGITGGHSIKIRTDGAMQCTNGSSVVVGSATLVNNTQYHLWQHYAKGTGANSVSHIHVATTDTKPGSADITLTDGTLTTDASGIGGYCASGAVIYDKFRVAVASIGSSPS